MEIEKQIQQYENAEFTRKRTLTVSDYFSSFIEGNFKNDEIHERGKTYIQDISKVNKPETIIKELLSNYITRFFKL